MKIGDIIYYFLVCLLQWFFSENLFFQNFSPNIIFIGVFSACILSGPVKSMFFAFLLGLFMDIYSLSPFGMNALFYVIISYLIYHLKSKLDLNSFFTRIVLSFILNYIYLAFYIIFYFAYFKSTNIFLWRFLLQPVITVIFLEPFFYFAYKYKRKNNLWL